MEERKRDYVTLSAAATGSSILSYMGAQSEKLFNLKVGNRLLKDAVTDQKKIKKIGVERAYKKKFKGHRGKRNMSLYKRTSLKYSAAGAVHKRADRINPKAAALRGAIIYPALLELGLEANSRWGQSLSKPQKLSPTQVDDYIVKAAKKGIYKPRFPR